MNKIYYEKNAFFTGGSLIAPFTAAAALIFGAQSVNR